MSRAKANWLRAFNKVRLQLQEVSESRHLPGQAHVPPTPVQGPDCLPPRHSRSPPTRGQFPDPAHKSHDTPMDSLATPTPAPPPPSLHLRLSRSFHAPPTPTWPHPHSSLSPPPPPRAVPRPVPAQSDLSLALATPWLHLSPEGPFSVLTRACLSSSPTSWPHQGPAQSSSWQLGILRGVRRRSELEPGARSWV